jgi:hypothetical protein
LAELVCALLVKAKSKLSAARAYVRSAVRGSAPLAEPVCALLMKAKFKL